MIPHSGSRNLSLAFLTHLYLQTEWKCHYWCHGDEESSDPNGDCGQAAERDSNSDDDVDITHFPWQVQVLARRRGGYEFVCSGALLVRERDRWWFK